MWQKDRGRRPKQVAKVLHMLLAQLIAQGVASDKASLAVNISEVLMSPDLRYAKVFYCSLADDMDECLKNAVPELKRRIAREVRLRLVPNVHFVRRKPLDLQGLERSSS